jgi:membrane-bound serine protease (ClpP class)
MSLAETAIFLAAVGLVLLIAELMLPAHGIVGLLGIGMLIGAVVVAFMINIWLGLGSMAVGSAITPVVGIWLVKFWPRTRIGRQLVLPSAENQPRVIDPLPVQIGQSGVTVSEMRPMGTCEFGGQRMEAISELGMIPPGKQIRVVNITNRRPTVRAIG